MCAIAGLINSDGLSVKIYQNKFNDMLKTMQHRGPDQSGMFVKDNIALIHARLSVVDLEKGLQPMTLNYGSNEYVIVYNGELYNTEDLRRELMALGHKFNSHSDTEVLLHSFAEWKDDCVEKLNGIFAFAVWDMNEKRLFVARDRIGVKPFFYVLKQNKFLFASEIKTLLASGFIEPLIDKEGLLQLMLLGPGRIPGSGVFKDVKELLPGECGYFNPTNGSLNTRIYWKLEDNPNTDSFMETVEKVRFLVLDSIERQLVSDVPVCTFISGGLDSSIISAVANRYFKAREQQLYTFSVDYRDNTKYFTPSKFQPSSDEYYIKIMKEQLSAKHHLVLLDNDELVSALYDAVDARDLPGMADIDSSLLLFCKQVKKTATVAISGECADEIFGGYPWYRDKTIRESEGFPWAQSTSYRAGFFKRELLGGINPHEFVNSLYKQTIDETSVLPGTNATEARMKQMMNLNFKWFMQTLLDRKDRMSMYSGLEVRVPFCDHRIAEYLYTVPWEFKDYNNFEKGLLRQAMKGILPDEVLWRKKSPYPKTHNPAYFNAVAGELKKVINDPTSPLLQFVNVDEISLLLNADNPTPWYGQLMTTPQTIAYFLQLNYWLKKYKVEFCG
ncbi:MAG: asparagine synthase (glutamine-hydrolyzing) [Acutalibacteraceae bacterium]